MVTSVLGVSFFYYTTKSFDIILYIKKHKPAQYITQAILDEIATHPLEKVYEPVRKGTDFFFKVRSNWRILVLKPGTNQVCLYSKVGLGFLLKNCRTSLPTLTAGCFFFLDATLRLLVNG